MRRLPPVPLLLAVLAVPGILAAPPVAANCETGAYLIHTTAEYAELDGAGHWFFHAGLRDGQLQLWPVATETRVVVDRLHRLLVSDDGDSFLLQGKGQRCRPCWGAPGVAPPGPGAPHLLPAHR